jgi:hypothetical protein
MAYKRLIILGYAGLGLVIASLSIFFGFEYLLGHNKWFGLIFGALFMILGIIVFQLGKKHGIFYFLSFFCNMIGVGLSITAYYVFKEFSLSFRDFIFAIFISMSVLSGFFLLSFIEELKKHIKWMAAVTILVSFIISLTLWLTVDKFSGLSFYFLNVVYFFMVGIIQVTDSFKDLSKEMAWISFGAFVLISIIVLIIFSEGEALSGFDGVDLGPGKREKKN